MRSVPWGRLLFITLIGLVIGCNPMAETGKTLVMPKDKDSVLFGISSFAASATTNRDGNSVAGLILNDASLVESDRELAQSTRRQYAIFHDFLLGNGVRGRYWQQQSEKRVGLGLPIMDTRSSKVTLVEVDSNHVVVSCKSMRAAHVTISVDTNDFTRNFKP